MCACVRLPVFSHQSIRSCRAGLVGGGVVSGSLLLSSACTHGKCPEDPVERVNPAGTFTKDLRVPGACRVGLIPPVTCREWIAQSRGLAPEPDGLLLPPRALQGCPLAAGPEGQLPTLASRVSSSRDSAPRTLSPPHLHLRGHSPASGQTGCSGRGARGAHAPSLAFPADRAGGPEAPCPRGHTTETGRLHRPPDRVFCPRPNPAPTHRCTR